MQKYTKYGRGGLLITPGGYMHWFPPLAIKLAFLHLFCFCSSPLYNTLASIHWVCIVKRIHPINLLYSMSDSRMKRRQDALQQYSYSRSPHVAQEQHLKCMLKVTYMHIPICLNRCRKHWFSISIWGRTRFEVPKTHVARA